ncbi:MAG: RQC domain-containing protein, partial [Oscillospiraceae bacterium]
LLYGAQDVMTCRFFIDMNQDQSELDPETQAVVRERDLSRLQQMKDYCYTSQCLRQYIMDYFGATEPVHCDNCSNCNAKFAQVDCTEEARKILSCVTRMGGRYGYNLVIETLLGQMSEKTMPFHFEKLTTYGILKNSSAVKLRELIDCLSADGYLSPTTAKYPLIQLGDKAHNVLFGDEKVFLRLSQEEKTPRHQRALPFHLDSDLFAALKKVRMELASAQGVPAFVVFSDTTLIDMCGKCPLTKAALLEVSGVGATKLERYGDAFLEALISYTDAHPAHTDPVPPTADEDLTDFLRKNVEISPTPLGINRLADSVSAALIQTGREKLSGIKLAKLLMEQGYLEPGEGGKIPTDKGRTAGITQESRKKASGEEYQQNLYGPEAQECILTELARILT